jgi:uncharacterized Zn finger protein
MALGHYTSPNEGQARKLAARAVELSREHGRLSEAADLMEESFSHWPALRDEMEYWVKLWRKGISV